MAHPEPSRPDPLVLSLLRELAAGRTTAQAALTCSVSKATAWRRLEELRGEWGVDHNIELIVAAVRRGLI